MYRVSLVLEMEFKDFFGYIQSIGGVITILGTIGFTAHKLGDIAESIKGIRSDMGKEINSLNKKIEEGEIRTQAHMQEIRDKTTEIKIEMGQLKTLVEVEGKHMYDKINELSKRIDKVEDKNVRESRLNG